MDIFGRKPIIPPMSDLDALAAALPMRSTPSTSNRPQPSLTMPGADVSMMPDPRAALARPVQEFAGQAPRGLGVNTVAGFTEGPAAIKAFHGSPHAFDKFSMEHIGKGEGAQAYGHGLYFAGSEDVARSYRDALGWQPHMDKPEGVAQYWLQHFGGDRTATAAELSRMAETWGKTAPDAGRMYGDALKLLPSIQPKSAGHMYEVNLHTDPSRLLDWDSGFKLQPPEVRAALKAATGGQPLRFPPNALPSERTATSGPTGGTLYNAFAAGSDPVAATERLRGAGIDGIQYLDAGSRAAGDGSRNYVMFDDALIEVLRRYGVAGALGGGAAATLDTDAVAAELERKK